MTNLGDLIKSFRNKAKNSNNKPLSQLDLSLLVGWENPSTLSRIESGEVKPTRETLGKISEALNLTVQETKVLFEAAEYKDYVPELTQEYINSLKIKIKKEWDKQDYPLVLLRDFPVDLVIWNESATRLFIGTQNVKDYENKSHLEVLFDKKYKIRENIVNWDEFITISVRNLYIWFLLHHIDVQKSMEFSKWLKLDDFEMYWNKVVESSSDFSVETININIPFVYKHPLVGQIEFQISTYVLYQDSRFFVEQFVPTTATDRNKINMLMQND